MTNIKNNLKNLRLSKNITQQELADQLNSNLLDGMKPISKMNISNWENGKHSMKPDVARLIADYFEVPLSYLLGYEKEINNALNDILPTAMQKTDDQYDHYLEIYKSSILGANEQLDNVVNSLNPDRKFSLEETSKFLIALAGEITKLETSSETLLKLKDIQIKNLTMKHELEQFKNYFENK
ncbi:helix-turn-helix domain-containing protein [Streptococcus hyovaginalis]|uniref:helix-turn-helix domain-containing protein n=1 Tax=Streptococcus hyovaginalis TaxID=149015 RepID=UPI003ADD684B